MCVRVRACVCEREDVKQGVVAYCCEERALASHHGHLLSITSKTNSTLPESPRAGSLYTACSSYHSHHITYIQTQLPREMLTVTVTVTA